MIWQTKKLREITEIITKGTTPTTSGFNYQDSGVNFVKIESISDDGNVLPEMFAHISEKCHQVFDRSQLEESDILYSIAGAIGRSGIVSSDILPANTNQALAIIRLKKNVGVSVNFVYLELKSPIISYRIKSLMSGVAQQNLSLSQISDFDIPLPELSEQQAIVGAVRDFDDYLEKVQKKLEAGRQLKKGLTRQILSGKLRFKDDYGQNFPDWEKKTISQITKERSEKTIENNQYDILTSSRRGIYKQDEYFGKSVASKDNIGYKVIHRGDFVYRAMTDDDIFVFNYNDKFNIGSVSPAYAVFSVKNVLPIILRELLNNETTACQLLGVIQGGTRKSLKFSSLKTIRLDIPSIVEQQKIANFLSDIDDLINSLEQLLEKAKIQKKWLLDNLVTGKVRLKEFRDE